MTVPLESDKPSDRSIYLRFISEKWSVISAAIRFATRHWASHVELIKVQGEKVSGYSDEVAPRVVDVLGSRWPHGVQHYSYITRGVTREEWYSHPYAEQMWQALEARIGQKYDLSAIFGIAFDADFHRKNRDICSEAVQRASEKTPKPIVSPRQGTWRITPRDLLLSCAIRYQTRILR